VRGEYTSHTILTASTCAKCDESPISGQGWRQKKLAGGARAVKVSIVSGVRESLQTKPIVLPNEPSQFLASF